MNEPRIPLDKSEWPLYRRMEKLSDELVPLFVKAHGKPHGHLGREAVEYAANILAYLAEAAIVSDEERECTLGLLRAARTGLHALSASLRMAAQAAPAAARTEWSVLRYETGALIAELSPFIASYAPPCERPETSEADQPPVN